MFKLTKKQLTLATLALLLAFSLFSTGIAQGATATITAQFKALKIIYNSAPVTLADQPVIINGRTYLPVRALSNLFEKNIDWNGELQQITIAESATGELATLRRQVASQAIIIQQLQLQLEDTSSSSSYDIDDMEDDLNDDFEQYNDMECDITLSGDEDDMSVRVVIDLDDSDTENGWDELDAEDRVDFLQDIVDDILDEFDDADIAGYIKDSDSGEILMRFTVDDEDVELDFTSDENRLNDDYDELGDIDDLEITVDGDLDDIEFTIFIDTDDFADEWADLSDDDIADYMKDIQDELEDAYPGVDVSGEILDSGNRDATMATLSTSGSFDRDSDY